MAESAKARVKSRIAVSRFALLLAFCLAINALSSSHMVDGSCGFLGADLSNYARSHPANEIRDAITHPDKNSDRRQKTVSVVTREGERFTRIARNEDNFLLQVRTPDGAFHLLMKSDLEHIDYE